MRVVISGSFRKHLQGIVKLKAELEKRGIEVIKPNRVKKINNSENPNFVKFEGEELIHPVQLEREYLQAIQDCDAHIIYNQDSYIGMKAAMEFGASFAKGKRARVYLYERPDLEKMLAQKPEVDEYEKQDLIEFYELMEDMIKQRLLKVGINQLYKDYNISAVTERDER